MRQISANSTDLVSYEPEADKESWDAAYEKYLNITNNKK